MTGFLSCPFIYTNAAVAPTFVANDWARVLRGSTRLAGQVAYPGPMGFGGGDLILGETDALGIDFTCGVRGLQMSVKDTGTPSNAGFFDPYTKLTYTSPSIKLCRQSDGVWRYGSHNLYLNSGSPATQSVTVVNGGTYNVDITGSVNITLSNAATGTITAGSNAITAASTTLTLTLNSGTGTVAVYRTPCVGTYLATTGSAVYDLPYEWDAAGVAQGIRIEEQRTNLIVRSQELDNGSWSRSNIGVTADNTTSPDGTTTAEKITANAGSAVHNMFQTSGSGAGATLACSLFAKNSTNPYVQLTLSTSSTEYVTAVFDLGGGGSSATQTGVGTTGTLVSTSQTDASNGWYRLTLVATIPSASATMAINVAPAASGNTFGTFGNITWNPAGTEAFFGWGAQVEVGSFPTSPIHTIGATVTRAIDTIDLATTTFPYSSGGSSSLYSKFTYNALSGAANNIFYISDGTTNNRYGHSLVLASNIRHRVQSGGITTVDTNGSGTISTGTVYKVAARIVTNDYKGYVNGSADLTDTSVTIPSSLTKLKFGIGAANTDVLNGYFKECVFLPRGLTDAELQARTT